MFLRLPFSSPPQKKPHCFIKGCDYDEWIHFNYRIPALQYWGHFGTLKDADGRTEGQEGRGWLSVCAPLLSQKELWDLVMRLGKEVLIPPNLLKLIRTSVWPLTVNLSCSSVAGRMGNGRRRRDRRKEGEGKSKWLSNSHQGHYGHLGRWLVHQCLLMKHG